MENLELFILHFGYFAVFTFLALGIFGLPMPDEVVVTSVGFFTSNGTLHYSIALLITILGVFIGTLLTFYIGKWIGKPLLRKGGRWIGIKDQSIRTTEGWIKKHGPVTVLFGFFIPGMRHIICYISGMGGMKTKIYLLYVLIGASVSTIIYLTIGYYIGVPFLHPGGDIID